MVVDARGHWQNLDGWALVCAPQLRPLFVTRSRHSRRRQDMGTPPHPERMTATETAEVKTATVVSSPPHSEGMTATEQLTGALALRVEADAAPCLAEGMPPDDAPGQETDALAEDEALAPGLLGVKTTIAEEQPRNCGSASSDCVNRWAIILLKSGKPILRSIMGLQKHSWRKIASDTS